MSALASLWAWLLRHPTFGVLGIFFAWVLVHHFVVDARLAHERDRALAQLGAERSAHAATKANFARAAADARMRAMRNAEQVEARQRKITEEIVDDYQARLSAARHRAGELERVREQARTAASGGRRADMPPSRAAAGSSGEAARETGFSARGESQSGLSQSDALIATEQAIQLDALIDWVEAQAALDSGSEARGAK